jgi:hypothetical protein
MGIELVWTVEPDENFDLYDFGRGTLDDAIENLKKDGELEGTAFVLTPDHLHCLGVSFKGQEEKRRTYQEVIAFAKKNNAVAIITLNDAWWGPPEAAQNYYPGKIKEEYGWECIHVTVSGPGLKNWFLEVKYRREKGKLLFERPTEESGGQLGMLAGWADDVKSVN